MITIDDLQEVPPIVNGLDLLKSDIKRKEKVFCVCMAAKEYQVGAMDAFETLERATGKNNRKVYLIKSDDKGLSGQNIDDLIYIPLTDKSYLKKKIENDAEYFSEEVQRVYDALIQINRDYHPGKRLTQQDPKFRELFITAFRQLRLSGILPLTTGNSAYNHQGMFLLMETCFRSYEKFIKYLQKPELLNVNEIKSGLIRKRAEEKKHNEQYYLISFLLSQNALPLEFMDYIKNNPTFQFKSIESEFQITFPEFIDILLEMKKFKVIEIDKNSIYLTKNGEKVLSTFE